MPDYSGLNAYRPHAAPPAEEREALRREIIAQADEIGKRGQGVTEQEIETVIDEALGEIRSPRQ